MFRDCIDGKGGRMTRQSQKTAVLVATMVFCAIILRVLGKAGLWSVPVGIVRSLIYIALYIGWGISVSKRIIQVQVRHYLLAISGLMVFWFVIRSTMYHFIEDAAISRQLWYCYYLPMLFIPLFSVFVAISLGKPANSRLPKSTRLLYLPTALCLLLVLTNDFHPSRRERYGRMITRDMNSDTIWYSDGGLSAPWRHFSLCLISAGTRRGKNICRFCC